MRTFSFFMVKGEDGEDQRRLFMIDPHPPRYLRSLSLAAFEH